MVLIRADVFEHSTRCNQNTWVAPGVAGGRLRAFTSVTKSCLTTSYHANNEMRGETGRIASCLYGDTAKLQQYFSLFTQSRHPGSAPDLAILHTSPWHPNDIEIQRCLSQLPLLTCYHASALLPEIVASDSMYPWWVKISDSRIPNSVCAFNFLPPPCRFGQSRSAASAAAASCGRCAQGKGCTGNMLHKSEG